MLIRSILTASILLASVVGVSAQTPPAFGSGTVSKEAWASATKGLRTDLDRIQATFRGHEKALATVKIEPVERKK